MREVVPNSAAFPTAQCGPCGKSVLTYVTLNFEGEEARYCVHCDVAIREDLRWLTAVELEAEGYEIGYRPENANSKSGAGCSSGGCGSCGTKKH